MLTVLPTLLYIFFFVVSVAYSYINFDPDFGWRIRYGGDILKNGLGAHDPYSYTMPSYHFVDHEWVTHVMMSVVYSHAGQLGLALIYASILAIAVLLVTRSRYTWWRSIQIMLIYSVVYRFFAPKPQVISWLMVALLVTTLTNSSLYRRLRWILPVFFVLWANMHGGFVFGIGLLILNVIISSYKNRRIVFSEVLVVIASAMATLINPYGAHLWVEILKSVQDPRLRLYVIEWIPLFIYMDLASYIIMGLYTALVFTFRRSMSMWDIVIYISTLLFGITSSRNIPLWIMASSHIATKAYGEFEHAVSHPVARQRLMQLMIVLYIVTIGATGINLYALTKAHLEETELAYYPVHAVEYLRSHPSRGNVFATYEWGGYLIWRYPEKRVFIDGRMPSWKQDPSRYPHETADAFKLYTEVFAMTTPMAPVFKTYHIDTILLPNRFITNKTKKEHTDIKKFLSALSRAGFHKIYHDTIATIYRKQ